MNGTVQRTIGMLPNFSQENEGEKVVGEEEFIRRNYGTNMCGDCAIEDDAAGIRTR
jgi:hypothetical protein